MKKKDIVGKMGTEDLFYERYAFDPQRDSAPAKNGSKVILVKSPWVVHLGSV